MVCSNCGKETGEANFCPESGTPISCTGSPVDTPDTAVEKPLILPPNVVHSLNQEAFFVYSNDILNYARNLPLDMFQEQYDEIREAVQVIQAETAQRHNRTQAQQNHSRPSPKKKSGRTPPEYRKKRSLYITSLVLSGILLLLSLAVLAIPFVIIGIILFFASVYGLCQGSQRAVDRYLREQKTEYPVKNL